MRKFVLVGLVALVPLSLVAVAAHLTFRQYFETPVLRIGTGGPGGTYHKMGDGFAHLFREDPRVQIGLAEMGFDRDGNLVGHASDGALENLRLLEEGEVDVAFVQGGLPKRPGVQFVMNLYRASVQIVVRRGLKNREGKVITEIEDLDDWIGPDQPCQRISIGSAGSGTRHLAVKILKFYQKDVVVERSPDGDPSRIVYQPHVRTLGFQESLLALKKDPSDPGAIDVAFFVSGTGTVDAIKKLLYRTDARGDLVDAQDRPIAIDPAVRLEEHEGIVPDLMTVPPGDESEVGLPRPRYRFLEIRRNRGLTIAYPYLQSFDVPRGTYSSRFSFPEKEIPTVSVYEMLCASEKAGLDWLTVNRLADAIWKKKALLEEVPQLAMMTEAEARQTTEYEAHPAAVDFFNHTERLPWPLILAAASALISVFGSLTKVRMWIFRWRMLREMAWVYSIEDRVAEAPEEVLVQWLARLDQVHHVLTLDFCKIRIGVANGIGIVLDRVRLVREKVRTRLKELRQAAEARSEASPQPVRVG